MTERVKELDADIDAAEKNLREAFEEFSKAKRAKTERPIAVMITKKAYQWDEVIKELSDANLHGIAAMISESVAKS